MNSIKILYKLMKVSSRDLEIPDAYQRKLNTERVAKIVVGFDSVSPTSRRSAFVTVTIMCLTDSILLWRAST